MDEASLNKLKIPELKEKCKQLGITGTSKLTKPALIAKLVASQSLASNSRAAPPTTRAASVTSAPNETASAATHRPTVDKVPVASASPPRASIKVLGSAASPASPRVPDKPTSKRPHIDTEAPSTLPAYPTKAKIQKTTTSGSTFASTLATTSSARAAPRVAPAHTSTPSSSTAHTTAATPSITSNQSSTSSSVRRKPDSSVLSGKRPSHKFVPPIVRPTSASNRIAPLAPIARPLTSPSVPRQPLPPASHLPPTLSAIQSSWLARTYRTLHLSHPSSPPDTFAFDAIAKDLYECDREALEVAMRFVVSRLGRELMLAGMTNETGEPSGVEGGRDGGWGQVTRAERVGGEIWEVEVAKWSKASAMDKKGESESWTVLGTTGEPLGLSPIPSSSSDSPAFLSTSARYTSATPPAPAPLTLRPDWSTYIASLSSASPPTRLSTLIQTPNSAEYPSGIRKAWWDSPTGGDSGRSEEGKVAERYVLASCIVQGTSGEYQSAQRQCDLFNGLASNTFSALNTHPTKPTTNPSSIQLFLPLSSHLSSLHLHTTRLASPTSPLIPLHPSLALVIKEESPDAVEYVLRETGQIVGAGEEGVGEVWREVLGCGERGVATLTG